MHPEPDNTTSRTSANGSPIPCFKLSLPVGLPPHTPPSGRPLDRDGFAPKPPSGGFPLPSPGERGEFRRKLTIITQQLTPPDEIVLK